MDKPVRLLRKHWLHGPLVALAILGVTDQIIVRALLETGAFEGRLMPDHAEGISQDQERWLREISGPQESRRHRIFSIDSELGWTNAPHAEIRDGAETTNSRGLRGRREYEAPKPPGVIRVLCFGDSYTWGADVSDEDSFPAAMERAMPGLEAPNFGVSAFGTDQALMRFRREGAELEPDHVVIGIMVENIGRHVNRYRPLWVPTSTITCVKPRFILEEGNLVTIDSPFHSVEALASAVRDGSVLELASAHEHWRRNEVPSILAYSPSARLLGSIFARAERKLESLWKNAAGEPYRVTQAVLKRFHAESISGGAKSALVVLLPHREALHSAADGAPRYWQVMLDELSASGIDVLDVTDALLKAHSLNTRGGKRSPMYTQRNHLRPPFNQVVAEAILDKLGLTPRTR